jgi:hypothetical protein
MSKLESDDDCRSARTVRPMKPARPARRFMTLETLNAEASASAAGDDLDFAGLDEPREPEKWY